MHLRRAQLMRLATVALIGAALSGCTTSGFWPERWVSDGASLWQAGSGRYQYTRGIGAAPVNCQADGQGVYTCDDGTVSRLKPIDGPYRQIEFDGRVFALGPL